MPSIQTVDAQALSTKTLVDVYKERSLPTAFLRSFFPNKVTPSLEVSIEVQRGSERIAVDVARGTDGNRNNMGRSTEKIIIPPYFREWFDATQLSLYDRLYGATEINDQIFAAYINSVADNLEMLQSKIERAYEWMCAQVLLTGIVTLNNGTNIDFKRKAASLVDPGAGQYFADNIDPFAQFAAGAAFIRTKGKYAGPVLNAILGETAMTNLLANTKFNARQNLFNMALDQVVAPQRNSTGANLNGQITAGAYKVNLWTYPQSYDDATGTAVPYIDPKKVIMLPETPRFVMAFGAVPQLITPNTPPAVGAFIFNDYIDRRSKSHVFDVESAGIPIPVAIDQLYTFKAVA